MGERNGQVHDPARCLCAAGMKSEEEINKSEKRGNFTLSE